MKYGLLFSKAPTQGKGIVYDPIKERITEVELKLHESRPLKEKRVKLILRKGGETSEAVVSENQLILIYDRKTQKIRPVIIRDVIVGTKKKGETFQSHHGWIIEDIQDVEINDVTVASFDEKTISTRDYLVFHDDGKIAVGVMPVKEYATRSIMTLLAELMTELLPNTLELEYEKLYRVLILVVKKKYAALKDSMKIDVKGLEYVRSDWTEASKALQKKVIELILYYNMDTAKELVQKAVYDETSRFQKGNYTPEEVVQSVGVKSSVEDYSSPNLPQVSVLKQLQERGIPTTGEVSYYVLVDKWENVQKKLGKVKTQQPPRKDLKIYERVVASELVDFNEIRPFIDVDYIIKSSLLPPTQRILDTVGITVELPGERKNRKLDAWLFPSSAKPKREMMNRKLTSFLSKPVKKKTEG